MPRIVRLSAFTVCSLVLVPLGLTGCDQRPADGTHVQIDEVERKQAIDKMRAAMETPRAKVGSRAHGSRAR
jgi:hypothetical protein